MYACMNTYTFIHPSVDAQLAPTNPCHLHTHTHTQSMPLDRELAATGLFPLILGGHDHDAHLEVLAHTKKAEDKSAPSAHSTSPSAAGQGAPRTHVSSCDVPGQAATVIVKVGVDCKAVGITDVVFGGADALGGVVVQSEMRDIGEFALDPAVERRVHVHLRVLEVRSVFAFKELLAVPHISFVYMMMTCVDLSPPPP